MYTLYRIITRLFITSTDATLLSKDFCVVLRPLPYLNESGDCSWYTVSSSSSDSSSSTGVGSGITRSPVGSIIARRARDIHRGMGSVVGMGSVALFNSIYVENNRIRKGEKMNG